MGSKHQNSLDPDQSTPCALWTVDIKLTHLDWSPEATLIHFQGQYLTTCELDYNILQQEIQNTQKTKAAVDIGECCLVEDFTSAHWYRGRVQNRKEDLFDVFLIDHGNVLSVDITHISSCSNDLFTLPPKIVCGFLANVLLLHGSSHSVVEQYLSSLVRKNVTGYIQALLPHKVLLFESPDINNNLVRHGFGRHVDTDTFLLLVELLTEVPLKQNIEPVPDLLIEKSRGQEFVFKRPGLQGYEDILSFSGPRLSCGTRAKVQVTAAVNPGLFYCQMASMETELQEMSKRLAAACEHRAKASNQQITENLGLLCSVQSKDGKWYRGFVQFLPINSQVRVLLIDYGFFEMVKIENVHRLSPDFYSTPIMAFPCSLSSLSDQDDTVRTQQLGFLKAGLLGGVLDIEISGFDEQQHLYSVTFIDAHDHCARQPEPRQELPRMEVESVVETKGVTPQGGYLYCETIMGEALGKAVVAEEVQVDSVFVGYVEYVQNPNHFWIRTQKRNDEFEEMMTKMADHFSQVKLDEDILLNPELGTLCCAVYEEDMHFYRGVVTDKLKHGAEVLFIDFGNIEKVPHELIKNIPEAFASKSAFAFCCTLFNVLPLDEVWTSTNSDFLRQAVSNKAMLIRVVQMRKNKFVVDLYEMGSDNNQSITDLMVSCNQAEYWNISTEPVVRNNVDVTEKPWFPTETSDISGNAKKPDEISEVRVPVSFKAFCIKPGCDFAVRCPYISSPSDFWCQPQDKDKALEELMDKMQQYYSTNTAAVQPGVSCCVAKSPQDGAWYRAFIVERQKASARVILVDYGFTIQIQEHNLQTILPEHVSLEGQAFRCSFSNLIEPTDPKNGGAWSAEVGDSVKEFVKNSCNSLRCEVVSQLKVKNKGLCHVVDLYNTQTHQTVTDWLIERGLAREATVSTKQVPTVSPESFVYSSYDLHPKKEEQVFVSHVSSQWEIYCQLERNIEVIEELEEKIVEETKRMMQASMKPVVRKLCLAKYLDGRWYRGLARAVQSPLHLSVFFVDYGNTNISEKTNVMFIPRDSADLLYTPMQAVRCCLASVSKEEPYADVKEWLDQTILNKKVKAVVHGKNEDGSFNVELSDGDVNINEKVKDLILSLSPKTQTVVTFDTSCKKTTCNALPTGKGKTSVKVKSPPKGQSSSSSKRCLHRGTRAANAPPKKTQNINQSHQSKNTKVKQQSEDKVKSCVTEKSYKNSHINQQREDQEKHTKTGQPQQTDETEIPQLSCLPDRPSPGQKVKCFVSHIDSVDSFFLQLSEDEPAILKMGDSLNSCTIRNSLRTITSLKINDLTLAEYEEDGALYRSVVKDYEGSSSFKVEFIDYGNSAVVGKEKIFFIPKEYLAQPRFSISCCLWDTSPYETLTSFTDAVMEKPLMVDFALRKETQWIVKVEVLDGAVCIPPALQVAVECSPTNKSKKVEAPKIDNETAKSERKIPTDEGKKVTLKSPAVTLPTKPKVKTYSYHRKRLTANKKDSVKSRRMTPTSTAKGRRNCADAFTHLTIKAKDRENGMLLSVESNGGFYVRLARTSSVLIALESYIAENLHKCKMVVKEDVKEGLKCLVQVQKDQKWQRAVVKHLRGEECKVLLVDHGTTEEIPSDSTRQQCGDLTKVPNLAVLCKINCSGLSDGEDMHRLWSETLKPMIGKEVTLVFVCYSEADELWMVEVVVNNPTVVRQITSSLQPKEETIPSLATEKEPSLDSTPPQQLTFAPIDIDRVYVGFAAAVTTPFEFCVALEDLLLTVNQVSITLDDLCGEMSPLPEGRLVHGTCCLFKSDSKNKWCRCEIVQADSTVILNLVDYGHYECIPYEHHSELKVLPEELMKLPKVTYPCSLRGVKPAEVDEQWTDEAAVFFQQCLYHKNLHILFREFVSNTHWKVDILTDGVHVAKELVDAGHANYIDVMLELRFQEQRPCEASPQGCDSEEECGQDDEGSREKSDLPSEDAEGRKPLSILAGLSQCVLM